jgi:hypothetical protein
VNVEIEYRFGRPTVYLAPHELARLTILRSRLGDTPAERLARAAGAAPPPAASHLERQNRDLNCGQDLT